MSTNKIFVVSQYTKAHQNSTGYIWSKIIDRIGLDTGRVVVVRPKLISEAASSSEAGPVVEKTFSQAAFNKNKLHTRLLDQILQTWGFCRKMLGNVRKGDIVFSGTNPAVLMFFFPILKRLLGFKWILLVHDVFPENLVPAKILKKENVLYRILQRLFDSVYRSPDRLIVIGRDMRELMVQKVGSAEKIVFIPNWASDVEVAPMSKTETPFWKPDEWAGRTVFQFFGNLGRVQGIGNILAAIDLTVDRQATFVFMGDGAMVDVIKEFIHAHPDRKVEYLGSVPSHKKNDALSACDIAFVTLEEGMLGLGVPSKAYYSMAADKPILAVMDKDSEIALTVREHGIGWQCDPANPQALAKLIDKVCQLDLTGMSGKPRKVLQDNFSEEKVLSRFSVLVREVSHQK
jgi:glycosyltransferase involved in cell wall biosynthesis